MIKTIKIKNNSILLIILLFFIIHVDFYDLMIFNFIFIFSSKIIKLFLFFINPINFLINFVCLKTLQKVILNSNELLIINNFVCLFVWYFVRGFVSYFNDLNEFNTFIITFNKFITTTNILFLLFWLFLSTFGIYFTTTKFISSKSLNIRRKYFHFLAFLMFIPGFLFNVFVILIFQISLMSLAFLFALIVLILLECIRCQKFMLKNISIYLNNFYYKFTDHNRDEFVITSHIYLLLGCALPLWLDLYYFII